MEQKLIQALSAHYTAKLHRAEANLINYFKNPGAIGEHPDIVEEMVKQVDQISAARGSLDVLNSMVQQGATESPSVAAPDTEEESK